MTQRLLSALSLLSVFACAATAAAQAPAFKVEKFDIKGDGGTDYVTADAATGRVFVSRATHMMVVDGATGKVLGDIPDTPGVHGAGLAPKAGHGFTTNGGDQTVTMFDLKTLAVLKQIKVGPGLDGIMYDEPDDKIILTNHSRPIGTLTALDPTTGDILATVELEDTAPEGTVTVVHQDSADKYTVVATVPTFAGAKTIAVDPTTHNVYLFQPERGPVPPAAPDAPPPPAAAPGGRGRGPQGPVIAGWFIVIKS